MTNNEKQKLIVEETERVMEQEERVREKEEKEVRERNEQLDKEIDESMYTIKPKKRMRL